MRFIPVATVSFLFTNNVQVIKASSGDVAAIDRHVVSFESSRLFPDADFFGDIDATKQSSDASDNPSRVHSEDANRSYGRIIAYPSFIQKMQKSMLGNINSDIVSAIFHDADEGGASFQEVQTLHLTKTSSRHVDCTMTVEGDKITSHPLKESDGLTSFYVQQADDAYLETDDDELCIPLVEGSAVSFNGGLPHRTVVKSGSVKLVGPFFLSSFANVGMDNIPLGVGEEAITSEGISDQGVGGVMLLELPSKIAPCYTTIIEKDGEFILVSGYTKVQFKMSEDNGETRHSTFIINNKDIGEAGVSICQLAEFSPDMQCVKESLEYYAEREEIAKKLWSILFGRCADDTFNFLPITEQGNVDPSFQTYRLGEMDISTLAEPIESTSSLQAVEGTKSGKISTSATIDEEHKRRRQKDNQ
jgi:hypothetical protein